MKQALFIMTATFLLLTSAVQAEEQPQTLPVPNMITMVDLGSHSCIPCKMMAPILDKLTLAYEGKAAIVFIDVWKNKAQAKRFKVSAIPTQVFFDDSGQELFRHQGFMDEASIIKQFTAMGVQAPAGLQ